jgi:hypothetical protein
MAEERFRWRSLLQFAHFIEMENTEEVIIAWQSFAERIVTRDILFDFDQKEISKLIKNPLPLDRSNVIDPKRIELFEQLVRTPEELQENIGKSFVSRGDAQRINIFCASGATGMGKTHTAYVLGRITYTAIIRVIKHQWGQPSGIFAKPWELLILEMIEIEQLKTRNSGDNQFYSNIAESTVSLLLLCYLDLSLNLIDYLNSKVNLSPEQKKEVLLRIHRNGTSESIIAGYFAVKLKELKQDDSVIKLALFNKYFDSLISKRNKIAEEVCICVDELQALEGLFPDLLLHRSARETNEENPIRTSEYPPVSSVSAPSIPELSPQEEEEEKVNFDDSFLRKTSDDFNRGLIYGLCSVLGNLAHELKLIVFVTGTALEMTAFRQKNYSPIKPMIKPMEHLYLLTESQIREILFHYFDIEAIVNEDPKLQYVIRKAVGRPNIYMTVLLRPLWDLLYSGYRDGNRKDTLTAEKIYQAWKGGKGEILNQFDKMFAAYFVEKTRALPNNPDLTTHTIYSAIAQSYLFRNGKETNVLTKRILSDGIKFGLLPISATTESSGMIDRSQEPLLFHAFESYLIANLNDSKHPHSSAELMESISGLYTNFEKGDKAELFTVLHIALTVLRLLKGDSSLKGKDLDRNHQYPIVHLKAILSPFFEKEDDVPAVDVPQAAWFASCSFIKDISISNSMNDNEANSKGLHRSFIQEFIKEDGSYDFSVILWHVDIHAGVDIAFLVHNEKLTDQRLVVMQLKNRQKADIPSALLSLHPALQYLTGDQRQYISDKLNNKSATAKWTVHNNCGFLYPTCENHRELLSQGHSCLFKKWIRVCLFAQPMTSKLLEHVKEEVYDLKLINVDKSKKWITFRQLGSDEWTSLMRSSPVILGTLQCSKFLTERARRLFIEPSTKTLDIPTTRSIWKPIEFTQPVIELFDKLKAAEIQMRTMKSAKRK